MLTEGFLELFLSYFLVKLFFSDNAAVMELKLLLFFFFCWSERATYLTSGNSRTRMPTSIWMDGTSSSWMISEM